MENPNQIPEKPTINKWRLVNLAGQMGFIIALPLVALGFLGKWVDNKLGTDPLFVLVGILLAIVSTTVWLSKKMKELIK